MDTAFQENANGAYKIEHPHRVRESSNLKWNNPEFSAIVDMNAEHIVSCKIVGDWDVSNDGCVVYTLKNHEHIEYLVKEL